MGWTLSMITFWLASTWTACQGPKPLPPEEGIHLVVLGSSTAAGQGPDRRDQGWAIRYEQYLKESFPNARLTNLAESGYLSYQLLPTGFIPPWGRPQPDPKRNITKALSLRPQGIIINLPSNDTHAGYGFEEQWVNLLRLVEIAQGQGVKVWVCTTQPRILPPEKVKLQERLRDKTLIELKDYAIDFWTGIGDCAGWPLEEFNSGDGTHLNAAGHAVLLERVIERNIPAGIGARVLE